MAKHELDCSEIDSLDEIDDDMQLALVWCNTHGKYEWHNIPLSSVQHGGIRQTDRAPLWSQP